MKRAKSTRPVALLLIGFLIAVAGVAFGVQAVAGKAALAAPTFTAKPANPTSSTSASFGFTGPNGATFQCRVDGAAFATCTSPKSYAGPLAQGAHTFDVRAVSGKETSATTRHAWTVDTTPPPAPSFTAKPAALSTTSSPSFSFTDTESGVTFRCSLNGSAYTVCTSPQSYANLDQGGPHSFGVQAVDAAGNVSAATTWSWSIDSIAPPAPVITTKPSDPTSNATNTFEWTWSGSAPDTIQCSVENGAWFSCSSPYTYVIGTTNNQQHQFAVRAVDLAGNEGVASYQFKYEKGLPATGMPFQITGSVSGMTLGTWKPIAITIENPNGVTIFVSALNVAIAADSSPGGCSSAANVQLVQSNVSSTMTVSVPPNSSITLPAQGAITPQIRLKNLPTVNQDVCKGKSFVLTYSGTATN